MGMSTPLKLSTPTGGFVGFTEIHTLITNCTATGQVVSASSGSVGGFVGWGEGVVEDSTAHGSVEAKDRAGAFGGQVTNKRNSTAMSSGPFRGEYRRCIAYGDVESDLILTSGVPGNGSDIIGIAGFIGYSFGGVLIEDCECFGSVTSVSAVGGWTGGFIGHAADDKIRRCVSHGTVTFKGDRAGGFLGRRRFDGDLTITDCAAMGDVIFNGTGTPVEVGGFVGDAQSDTDITNSFSVGLVNVTGINIGGFVGDDGSGNSFSGCYWDTDTSLQTASQPAGVFGRTTAQMQQQATFVGWDFVSVWDIDENLSYPFLR